MFSIMDMIEALADAYEDLDDYAKEDIVESQLAEWADEDWI